MMSTYKNNSIRSIDEQRQKALEIAETWMFNRLHVPMKKALR